MLLSLPKREFGKMMAYPAEKFVQKKIQELNIEVHEEGVGKSSAGHYDLYTDNNFRIQVKFRSVDGITPTSKPSSFKFLAILSDLCFALEKTSAF